MHKSRGGRLGEAIKEADWAVVPSESGSGHEGVQKDSATFIKELTWWRRSKTEDVTMVHGLAAKCLEISPRVQKQQSNKLSRWPFKVHEKILTYLVADLPELAGAHEEGGLSGRSRSQHLCSK